MSEISSIGIRGRLGSFIMLFTNAGTVFSYILCNYTNYFTLPWISISICVIFLMGYWIVPETPKYLMLNDKDDEAIEAIRFFNGRQAVSEIKIYQMKPPFEGDILFVDEEIIEKKLFESEKRPILKLDTAAKRGLILGNVLMNIVIFSGLFTFANYYDLIFKEAGSNLSPAVSSIIVGTIQLTGTISASSVIEKVGRKPLILVSAYGSAMCVAVMGLHAMLKDLNFDVTTSFSWVPLLCLSLLVFIAANGAQSVPFVVLGEIFAQDVRGPLISICSIGNWVMSFVLVLVFPYLVEYLKIYGALWIYTVIECLLATVVLVMMPETKGVSIERIVQILGKKL